MVHIWFWFPPGKKKIILKFYLSHLKVSQLYENNFFLLNKYNWQQKQFGVLFSFFLAIKIA